MKLLTKYNRANIITALIVLLASSITYYFIIRTILIKQLDKDLKVEEQEIYDYVDENKALPNASDYKGQKIKFEPANHAKIQREIVTATIVNAANNENERVRILSFPIAVNGVLHKAIVIKSQVEAEDLLAVIVLVTGAIFLLLLFAISLTNRFLLGKLWQPFYNTLQQLQTFDVNNSKAFNLPVTNLEEFNELNNSVTEMTKRIYAEFETLKAFTDNASHEMQTPLAIINSKLDILLQTSTEKQAEQLQAIYNATGRLIRLNQTLLLLTKINNQQFKSVQKVDLTKILQLKLQQFDELVKAKNIKISTDLEQVFIDINEELVEILLNNLISNAIKHNYDGGFINCVLNKRMLQILSSGPALTFNEKDIFNRFQKSDHSTGTGLGLAVVQQICENSGLTIEYNLKNDEHLFTVFLQND